jgi:predicted AAA+ superfamily ATPase
MQQVSKEEILRRLRLENPWWEPPHEVPSRFSQWSPRPYLDIFFPLWLNRKVQRAVVLMGPRRVGKTYLLHHSIQRLISDQSVNPNRVCYVAVDNPIYVHLSLEQIMEIYSEVTGVSVTSTETYFIFDEIQYLRNWEVHLKSIVDTFTLARCVASGSAAAALKLKSDESGAGRFTDFLLPPLTFHEYLSMLGDDSLVDRDVSRKKKFFSTEKIDLLNEKFVHYLNFGGYPEVVFSKEIQDNPGRFIKSDIIDKVLLRDLPSLYGIQDIQELNSLFTFLAYNTAQEVSLEQLSQKSGVSKHTIKKYIEYLEAAFLIRLVHRVDHRGRYFQRARTFKVYLANPSMRTALFSDLGNNDDQIGALVETGIFAQWFHSQLHGQLHYARWRDGEIDIVAIGAAQKVSWALEVKWSDRYPTRLTDLNEAVDFCRRNKLPVLNVTTRTLAHSETLDGIEISFLPAALYAFTVGFNIVNRQRPPLRKP